MNHNIYMYGCLFSLKVIKDHKNSIIQWFLNLIATAKQNIYSKFLSWNNLNIIPKLVEYKCYPKKDACFYFIFFGYH